MACAKLEDGNPFFEGSGEESGVACSCVGGRTFRQRLMTLREAAVGLIGAVIGGAAGAQTDGALGAIVGVFICGCVGVLAAMMLPGDAAQGKRVEESAPETRERLREAIERSGVPTGV